MNKILKTFADKNNLTVIVITFRCHGRSLRRKGFDLCKPNGRVVATFEPCDFSNGDKWKLTGANEDKLVIPMYLKRITKKVLNLLDIEAKTYTYNSVIRC